jgi:hypothetical protein
MRGKTHLKFSLYCTGFRKQEEFHSKKEIQREVYEVPILEVLSLFRYPKREHVLFVYQLQAKIPKSEKRITQWLENLTILGLTKSDVYKTSSR